MFFGWKRKYGSKIKLGQKLWAIVTQSIKAPLRWKFWVQDLLHEPKVLPASLAHLVARMAGLMQKVQKEPTHTLQTTLSQFPHKLHELGP